MATDPAAAFMDKHDQRAHRVPITAPSKKDPL